MPDPDVPRFDHTVDHPAHQLRVLARGQLFCVPCNRALRFESLEELVRAARRDRSDKSDK